MFRCRRAFHLHIAFAANGDVFIVRGHGKASRWSPNSKRTENSLNRGAAKASRPGNFDIAHSIVIDRTFGGDARDEILVADTLNWRVQKYVRK
jgi:hypothetical protein